MAQKLEQEDKEMINIKDKKLEYSLRMFNARPLLREPESCAPRLKGYPGMMS